MGVKLTRFICNTFSFVFVMHGFTRVDTRVFLTKGFFQLEVYMFLTLSLCT